MKKLFLLIISSLMIMSSSFGQFVPPTLAETIYPNPSEFFAMGVTHTSCFAMKTQPNYFSDIIYIYGWNDDITTGPVQDGVAWMNTSSTNFPFTRGILPGITEHVLDVEVGLFKWDGGDTYAMVTYYKPGGISPGHYCNIYHWTSPGFVLESGYPMQLSTSTTYGRISMDIHNSYAIAIAWQEGNNIKVKVAGTTGGPLISWADTKTVTNALSGRMPDVAFFHTSDILLKMVYFDPVLQRFIVSGQTLSNLSASGSSIAFTAEDSNPAPSYYLSAPSSSLSSKLNIDCPDHYPYDNWAYVYQDGNDIKTRLVNKSVSTAANTYNLTGGLFSPAINTATNIFPTLVYNYDAQKIMYGWWTNYDYNGTVPGVGGYMSVILKEDGSPLGGYQIVNNLVELGSNPVMSFSKESITAMPYAAPLDYLFAFFPLVHPTGAGLNMKLKFKPWATTNFRPGETTGITTEGELSQTAFVYPNPFTKQFTLSVGDDNSSEIYGVVITNLQGSILAKVTGTVQQINEVFAEKSNTWPKGFYLIKVDHKDTHTTLKVIKN